jgi:predicted O-methyltransferase YrrM
MPALSAALHFALWRFGVRQAYSQTNAREREALARRARGCRRLVEIGVSQGVTTRQLRAAMPPEAELWAVDPYPPNRAGLRFSEMIARGEVSSVPNGRVRWIRTTGVAAAELWRSEHRPAPDFVFIDGDHSWKGISEDWSAWGELLGPNGVIALHDSRSTPEHPLDADSVRFTQSVVLSDTRFRVVEEIDSLTVLERVADGSPPSKALD